MRSVLLVTLIFLSGFSAYSQDKGVGVGTTAPHASAELDVTSTKRGFLPPRMTFAQRNAIVSPAAGLIIWCSDCGPNGGLYIFNGNNWVNTDSIYVETDPVFSKSVAKSIAVKDTQDWNHAARNINLKWSKNGDIVDDGQFIGTLNNKPLLFRINNQNAGFIGLTQNGNVAFGHPTLLPSSTGTGNVGIGSNALEKNNTGSANIGIGAAAMQNNTSGVGNIGIGNNALKFNIGSSSNIAVGSGALMNLNSPAGVGYNTAIGEGALLNLNTGLSNSAFGVYSLSGLTTGSENIGIGRDAGKAVITGSRNIFIGMYSDATDAAIFNATAIGYGSKVSQSNSIVLGGTGEFAVNVGIGTPSPERKLHINAVMRLEPIPSPPADPAKGDMYFDSTMNKLRVFDGNIWQNCW